MSPQLKARVQEVAVRNEAVKVIESEQLRRCASDPDWLWARPLKTTAEAMSVCRLGADRECFRDELV